MGRGRGGLNPSYRSDICLFLMFLFRFETCNIKKRGLSEREDGFDR